MGDNSKPQESVETTQAPAANVGGKTDDILVCCALGRCVNHDNLKKCGDCGLVCYCCREHQVEHYKDGHRLICPGRGKGKPLSFQECFEKASAYYKDQKWNAALMYYSAMLELTERVLGILHIQNSNCLDVMALCYKHQNKLDYAIQCLQRCLLIREINSDGSHENNKASANLLGRIAEYYILNDQLELAKQFLIKTAEEIKKTFGEDSFELGKAFCSLAVCYDKMNEVSEAEKILLEAVALDKYTNPTNSDELVLASNAQYNLGIIYSKQKRHSESLKYYEKALQMRTDAKLSVEHDDIVDLKLKIEEQRALV